MNIIKIMKLSNLLVSELNMCEEFEFVDRIIAAVCEGEIFTEEEIFDTWSAYENENC